MAFLEILALSTGISLVVGALTTILADTNRAARFPGLGTLPGVLVPFDLGLSSQVAEFAILLMGGLFGYYLFLSLWRGAPQLELETHEPQAIPRPEPNTPSVAATAPTPTQPLSSNLADYL